jgi:hypothetical protein
MLSHNELLTILFYNPKTGDFLNRETGKSLGCIKTCKNGYERKIISIKNQKYKASRLAWFYMTGRWPKTNIDHIDTDSLNNKWHNLREATKQENGWNRGPQSNNTSGYKNITWHKQNKKWQVKFQIDGRNKSFGLYEDIELANLVACEVRDVVHGQFARHK